MGLDPYAKALDFKSSVSTFPPYGPKKFYNNKKFKLLFFTNHNVNY